MTPSISLNLLNTYHTQKDINSTIFVTNNICYAENLLKHGLKEVYWISEVQDVRDIEHKIRKGGGFKTVVLYLTPKYDDRHFFNLLLGLALVYKLSLALHVQIIGPWAQYLYFLQWRGANGGGQQLNTIR